MTPPQGRPLGTAVCPWCSEEVQVALPLLEPPPESVKLTRGGTLFESTWLARLIEEGNCPACRSEIRIWWYGGFRWE
jgi:Zn ribbon nucleic-acid-binding protein